MVLQSCRRRPDSRWSPCRITASSAAAEVHIARTAAGEAVVQSQCGGMDGAVALVEGELPAPSLPLPTTIEPKRLVAELS